MLSDEIRGVMMSDSRIQSAREKGNRNNKNFFVSGPNGDPAVHTGTINRMLLSKAGSSDSGRSINIVDHGMRNMIGQHKQN